MWNFHSSHHETERNIFLPMTFFTKMEVYHEIEICIHGLVKLIDILILENSPGLRVRKIISAERNIFD